MDWFYNKLIILIKQRKIPYKNLGKALLFSKNQVFCPKIWKLWHITYPIVQYLLLKLRAHFLLINVYKKACGIFLFFLGLGLSLTIKKTWFLNTGFFAILLINRDLNKIQKSRTPFCRHYSVENVCKTSAKYIKLYGSWSFSKFWYFQTKSLVSWKEFCFNLGIAFCIIWLVLTKYDKNSS